MIVFKKNVQLEEDATNIHDDLWLCIIDSYKGKQVKMHQQKINI